MWRFTRGEIGYLIFFWKLWRYFVLSILSFEVFNFLLVILGVFKYFLWSSHKWRNEVYAFFNVNFESFLFLYFEILKFLNFLLVILEVSHGGKLCWVYYLKIWGFSKKHLWSSKIFHFVLRNFKSFLKTFNELEVVVPFVPTHDNILN